jgi:hypothetical protein
MALAQLSDEHLREELTVHRGTVSYQDYLSNLAGIIEPQAYLEIGTLSGASLSRLDCPSIAIDPSFSLSTEVVGRKPQCLLFQMTSDDFFKRYDPAHLLGRPLDLAFLDGMHLYEYLLRDIINTEKHCHRDSLILLHDCLPPTFEMTSRAPRGVLHGKYQHYWTGDVWKVIPILRAYRPDMKILYVDAPPTGLVILTNLDPSSRTLQANYDQIVHEFRESSEDFDRLRHLLRGIKLTSSTQQPFAKRDRSPAAAPIPEGGMRIIGEHQRAEVVARNRQVAKCDLERLYYEHEGLVAVKWHHYLSIYDRHLGPYRNSPAPLRILEIGVQNGGSLQLWRKFFGAQAIIYGIDIAPGCKAFEKDGWQVRIGDQSDPAFLQRVVDEMGGLDVVLDDGSHIGRHQVASFRALWPQLSPGGIYICEDLHASYWDGWEGGQRRTGTFIETIKDMVDEIHRWYAPIDTPLSQMHLHKELTGLHIYDSTAIFDKACKEEPYVVQVGQSTS